MKKRVTVTISERDYTLLASEEEAYVKKVAAYVNEKLLALTNEAKLSIIDAAIMTAVNIGDEYFKALESAENLRRQLKEYLDEASKTKMELSEAKREIFRLQEKRR